ncbi:putative pentatricopeptide repeat-containing protein At5g52630 [Punica granatum]|uniref:DYW domain-containing protein n=2 Tax=Punica granatum TaxID=22663 RepID=A0A218WDC8_PUNGR|nr:putative pentatricopeptide repeat-containing protein At5g52630 [Punica granatum]OWM70835.1 hypothetical protein CDL15_Pgr014508 [Punica granatum]PKI79357.1 hypothetical protein CRG98_000235 [Punica granatum]
MALVLPIAASASPATLRLPREPSQPSFFNTISSNCERKSRSSKILAPGLRRGGSNATVQLFDELPDKYDWSSSSGVSSSPHSGGFDRALISFQRMLIEGSRPDGHLLRTLLEESKAMEDIGLGKQLHSFAIRGGFGVDIGVRVALINMYADLGMLGDSRRIFYEISRTSLNDRQLWHAIISAYISHNYLLGAFSLYHEMLSLGFDRPTASTHVSIVKACGSSGEERFGMMIHGRIIKDEELVKETNLQNCLVTFYAKGGRLGYANRLFQGIHRKDIVSWNAIISANELNRRDDEAIHLFYLMIRDDPFVVQPNRVTFLSILASVSRLGALRLGKEIHGYIIRSGTAIDTTVVNALITMYSRCKEIGKAEVTFERTLCKDIITWNSMLAAYEKYKLQEKCFNLFNRMQASGQKPDYHSFTILCSAAALESPAKRLPTMRAREIHGHILRRCSLEVAESAPVCNSVLKMYSKCGCIEYSKKVFDGMRHRDSYSWNAIIDGYSHNKQFEDAFLIYIRMLELDLEIDHFTYSILLTSCGSSVSLHLGKQLHSIILKTAGGQETDSVNENALLSITNSLISMYSKCGSIEDASKIFLKMERRDLISWTAMITGYGEHGMVLESFQLFERMKESGVDPNEVTFLGLLMACSHGGLVEMGTHYFRSMTEDYGLCPSLEHYASMVDLYGRAGELNRAREFLESAISNTRPDTDDEVKLWKALLSSCHSHKELDLGVKAAIRVLELAPEEESTRVQLSNLYAISGLWEDAIKVRRITQEKELKKEVGCSWIDVKNTRHTFVAGDMHHEERREIYEKLGELEMKVRELGYCPITDFVVHDVEEIEKEAIVQSHSERLAVAFGLLKRRTGITGAVQVIKNLRVCRDCHNWMKFTSLVEKAEIVLRDSRRFHCFRDGKCTCGDFW